MTASASGWSLGSPGSFLSGILRKILIVSVTILAISNFGLSNPLANSSGFSYFGETFTTTIAPATHSRRWLCMWFEYAMISPYRFFLAFPWAVMIVLFSTEMHTETRGRLSFLKRTRSTVLTALAVLTSEFFLGVKTSD